MLCYNGWSCRGDKFQSQVIIVPFLLARPRASNAWMDTWTAMTTLDWIRFFCHLLSWFQHYNVFNEAFLMNNNSHVSNEIETQPGSSKIGTDPCLTSVFSPWCAPWIRLDGGYAKSQFSAACIFCHRLNRTFFCQLYLWLISYQSLLVFCWSKPKLTVVSISSLEYLK